MSNTNRNNSNTMQALWVGIGNLASFAFTLISSAILSRYLYKADYGTYKQVMYVYNTLLMVFTLGLPKAYSYFLPKNDIKYGNSIVSKINSMFFVLGLSFSLILFFGADIIGIILNNNELPKAIRYFAIAPAFILPAMGIEGIMSVYRRTIINTLYIVATRLLMLLFVTLPVIVYKAEANVAVIGFSMSSILSFIVALYVKKIPFRGIQGEKTSLSYKEILRFSVPLAVASFGGIAIKAADQFFISRYYGSEIFADFANGAIELPFVGMVLGATATVLLPVFTKQISSDDKDGRSQIAALWSRATEKSAMILYPLVTFCLVFATEIMVFLYGSQYEQSGVYFRIMLLVNFFTVAPYYPIIIAYGKTDYYAKVHLLFAALIWIIDFIIVSIIKNPCSIAYSSISCHILKIVVMAIYISTITGCKIKQMIPFKRLLEMMLICVCVSIVTRVLVDMLHINNLLLYLLVSFGLFLPISIAICQCVKIDYFSIVKPLIKRK